MPRVKCGHDNHFKIAVLKPGLLLDGVVMPSENRSARPASSCTNAQPVTSRRRTSQMHRLAGAVYSVDKVGAIDVRPKPHRLHTRSCCRFRPRPSRVERLGQGQGGGRQLGRLHAQGVRRMSGAPVVLVTGGGRGIRAAVCLGAAKAGWSVVVNYASNAEAADAVDRRDPAGAALGDRGRGRCRIRC